jgi:DNA adenine methylase
MSILGSKAASGAYQTIISMMPPHDTYIESHFGEGHIFSQKPGALKSYGVELDIDNYHKAIKEHSGIELVNRRAEDFLTTFDYDAHGQTFIYCDPPYHIYTRSMTSKYKHDYTPEDHCNLLDILVNLPADVMISGYPCAMYDYLLKNWNKYTFQAMTRGGVRTEVVWFNFDLETRFCLDYAGVDRTERQRIKRKVSRWEQKYTSLPTLEKQAILSRLLSIEISEIK